MIFDLECSNQLSTSISKKTIGIYEYFFTQAKKGGAPREFTRLAGFPVGLAQALLTIAGHVAELGESIIKGGCNLVGAPFSKKCKAIIGAKQLFLNVPLQALYLIEAPIAHIAYTFFTTIGFLVNPFSYTFVTIYEARN